MSVFGIVVSRAVLFRVALAVGLAGAGIATTNSASAIRVPDVVLPNTKPDKKMRRGPLKSLFKAMIASENRIENQNDSCAWACCAMILSQQGQLEAAKVYVSNRSGAVSLFEIANELNAAGYSAKFVTDSTEVERNSNAAFREIEANINAGLPCVFVISADDYCATQIARGMNPDTEDRSCHAMVLVHLDEKSAVYIDPNSIETPYRVSRNDFFNTWNRGSRNGLVIYDVNTKGARR